jgi:membrane associated rhomboid family serine protease
MVLPLYDEGARQRVSKPYVTWTLVAINVVAFFTLCLAPEPTQLDILQTYGFTPASANTASGLVLTPLSGMFLHMSWDHVFFNMLFLAIFGDNVEDAMGHVRYIVFYLACGYAGDLAYFLSDMHSTVPAVGASGAISGVIAAYVMIRPCAKVEVLLLMVAVAAPAYLVIGFYAATQVWSVMTNLHDGVAYWAHIGGIVMGAALVPLLRHPEVTLFECVRAEKQERGPFW